MSRWPDGGSRKAADAKTTPVVWAVCPAQRYLRNHGSYSFAEKWRLFSEVDMPIFGGM